MATDDQHRTSATNPEVSQNLLAYIRRHFPPLPDALPGQPCTFALLGFNGYGLSFAHLGGKVLSQQLLAGQADHEAAPLFAPRRFQ